MEKNSEQEALWVKEIIKETFSEQKKARRWGVLFKSLTFIYLFIVLILFIDSASDNDNSKKVQRIRLW